MGVDIACFESLVDMACDFPRGGRSLMLGRQKLIMKNAWHRRKFEKAARRVFPDFHAKDIVQADRFSERAFAALGYGEIQTMDISDYEFGPQTDGIIHDLNLPVDEALHGQFDFIYDGGTLEHIFNVPMALTNVFNMLKPKGRLFATNPLNGWPTHGMYQFSPELVYTFWSRMAGCKVRSCKAVSLAHGWFSRDIADTQGSEKRVNLRSWRAPLRKAPPMRLCLQYEVEKTAGAVLTAAAQQQDYVARWSKGGITV